MPCAGAGFVFFQVGEEFDEVAEVFEPAGKNRGGSSTMPQKRNPVACAVILSAAARVPSLASTMLAAMSQEHERGLGGWQAEWETLPELVRLTAGAVAQHHTLWVVAPDDPAHSVGYNPLANSLLALDPPAR